MVPVSGNLLGRASRILAAHWLSLFVLFVGLALRLIYLDADPHHDIWNGYITDEGRWIQQARALALFGNDHFVLHELHLLIAPAFEFTNYLIFETLGVSRTTSRLFTALCGCGILLLVWLKLRHVASPLALLIGMTLLAFQPDLLVLSRISTPDIAALFFLLSAYFVIVSGEDSPRRLSLAGLLVSVAITMKATVAPVAAIFSIMIILMPRQCSPGREAPENWRSLLWFWLGIVAPFGALIAAGLICCSGLLTDSFVASIAGYVPIIARFLRLDGFYGFLSFPFEDPLAPTLNLLALGLWISALAWLASGRTDIDDLSRRYLVTSTVWTCLYGFVMLLIAYYPSRYQVQIAIPMIINLMIGITLFQRLGFHAVIRGITAGRGFYQFLRLGLLGLPSAAFIAPLFNYMFGITGGDVQSLRFKLLSVLIAWIIATYVIYQIHGRPRVVGAVLLFPLIGSLVWLAFSSLPMDHFFWPGLDGGRVLKWLLFLLLAWVMAAASVALVDSRPRYERRLVNACAALVLGVLAVKIAPGYLDPHYSLKETSRDLGDLLAGASSVGTYAGEGLFSDNSLKYASSFHSEDLARRLPEFLVVVFYPDRIEKILARHYQLVKTYSVYVSAEYYEGEASAGATERPREPAWVYKRVSDL